MSSSPTAPISTTVSSTSSPFLPNASTRPAPPDRGAADGGVPSTHTAPPDRGAADSGVPRGRPAPPAGAAARGGGPQAVVIACGALSGPIREIASRRHWPVELHSLPSLLHNRPAEIAPEVERLAWAALDRGLPVAVAYADCGTYGALDEVCGRLGLARLPGLHCYDLLAGPARMTELFADEPGTYVLTDFLVRSFRRSVLVELGLDRYPELWPDYFGHYRRVVWLAQHRDPALEAEAESVAAMFGLPLKVLDTGTGALERALEDLIRTTTHIDHDPPALFTPDVRPAGRFVQDQASQRGEKSALVPPGGVPPGGVSPGGVLRGGMARKGRRDA